MLPARIGDHRINLDAIVSVEKWMNTVILHMAVAQGESDAIQCFTVHLYGDDAVRFLAYWDRIAVEI